MHEEVRLALDLVALDEDVPRVLGVPLHRTRLAFLGLAAVLTAAAACAVGALGFVGLAAGLVTALLGAPYFVWLLWRSRGTA